ncbi:MAG: hypothetical protein ACTSUI_06605, partial [Promethearchaeota archaeon]
NNFIKKFEGLSNLRNLNFLELSKNCFGEIPGFEGCEPYEFKDLSYGDVIHIPAFQNCVNLDMLYLCPKFNLSDCES